VATHFVIGDEVDRASGAQQEPMGIGREDLHAKACAAASEAAADADSRARLQTREIGSVEFEADRRPHLARIDLRQRVQDVLRVRANGDLGAPDARLWLGEGWLWDTGRNSHGR
jgi:hypothetical protein